MYAGTYPDAGVATDVEGTPLYHFPHDGEARLMHNALVIECLDSKLIAMIRKWTGTAPRKSCFSRVVFCTAPTYLILRG